MNKIIGRAICYVVGHTTTVSPLLFDEKRGACLRCGALVPLDELEEKLKYEGHLIREWLENKKTTQEICKELRIGLDGFSILLRRHQDEVEKLSFERGEVFINETLKSLAERTHTKEEMEICMNLIKQYKNKEISLGDVERKMHKLGFKVEHIIAIISIETKKTNEELFRILDQEVV